MFGSWEGGKFHGEENLTQNHTVEDTSTKRDTYQHPCTEDSRKSRIFTKTDFAKFHPGGVLGKKQLTKLKIYSGNDHPHSAQNPKLIELDKLNKKNVIKN